MRVDQGGGWISQRRRWYFVLSFAREALGALTAPSTPQHLATAQLLNVGPTEAGFGHSAMNKRAVTVVFARGAFCRQPASQRTGRSRLADHLPQ
jgi:hypothetical protein